MNIPTTPPAPRKLSLLAASLAMVMGYTVLCGGALDADETRLSQQAIRSIRLSIESSSLLLTPGPVHSQDSSTGQAREASAITWPFFVFDNGVGRDQGWPPKQQAQLTARLGFDGIGYSGLEDLESRYAACETNGQRIFSQYVGCSLGEAQALDPVTVKNLPQLQGKDAVLWMYVRGKGTDDEAIATFQEIADMASKYGVRVAIYPHHNFFVETGRHALRLAKAVDRENFGISINVCHELKAGRGDDLVDLVNDSIDQLLLVSINGADHVEHPEKEVNWSRLIQPLGEGDFDILPMLRQLRKSGYRGPIGLQCYQVPGKTDEVLEQSIAAWRKIVSQIGTD